VTNSDKTQFLQVSYNFLTSFNVLWIKCVFLGITYIPNNLQITLQCNICLSELKTALRVLASGTLCHVVLWKSSDILENLPSYYRIKASNTKPASCWLLAWLTIWLQRQMWYTPKCRLTWHQTTKCNISEKTEFFTVTTASTSNLTKDTH
jgi:hypothetical protein